MSRIDEIQKRMIEIGRQVHELSLEGSRLEHERNVLESRTFNVTVQQWIDGLDAFPEWAETMRQTDWTKTYGFNKYTIPDLVTMTDYFKTQYEKADFWKSLGGRMAVRIFLDHFVRRFGMEEPYFPGDWATCFYLLACYHLSHPDSGVGYPKTKETISQELLDARKHLWKAVFALAEVRDE